MGDAFGPGYSGLAYARLLLRNEPSPTYPYRNFCFWVLIKFFGEFFLSDTFRCWWDYFLMKLCYLVELFFGRCLRPGLIGLAAARLPLAKQALRIPIAIFCEVINFVILFFGRCFRKIKTMPLYKKQTHKKTRL